MQQKPEIIRNKTDKSILISPQNPKNSLIWLHGLGDSSQGFFDYFLEDNSPVYSGTRVLLLQAPNRPVTINGGMMCNSWYDIKSFAPGQKQEDTISIDQVKQSYNTIQAAVDSESKFWQSQGSKIPASRRILLGGFSQGCAMTLYYGLQCSNPLLGLVGFSGLLFQSTQIKNLGKTKVLLYHGSLDPVIPLQLAQFSYQKDNFLKNQNVKYTVIPNLPHSVNMQQLKQTSSWITKLSNEQQNK